MPADEVKELGLFHVAWYVADPELGGLHGRRLNQNRSKLQISDMSLGEY
jgi:hypothetical protein